MTPASAFIVRVPEAESLLASLRDRFDPSAKLGVPAHITVLFPFMPPDRITAEVLRRATSAFRAVRSFDFMLSEVRRWPQTTYLVPEPQDLFVELTNAAVRQFPEFPPYAGRHSGTAPHLTVADGSAEAAELAEAELRTTMTTGRQIRSRCSEIELLENSSGVWKTMKTVPLHGSAG